MVNPEKLQNIMQLLDLATVTMTIDQGIDQRSQILESLGFGLYDSFHIACAEASKVDVF